MIDRVIIGLVILGLTIISLAGAYKLNASNIKIVELYGQCQYEKAQTEHWLGRAEHDRDFYLDELSKDIESWEDQ